MGTGEAELHGVRVGTRVSLVLPLDGSLAAYDGLHGQRCIVTGVTETEAESMVEVRLRSGRFVSIPLRIVFPV
jgi:hypothetical protein